MLFTKQNEDDDTLKSSSSKKCKLLQSKWRLIYHNLYKSSFNLSTHITQVAKIIY